MGPIAYVVSEEVPPSKFLKPYPQEQHDNYHVQCMLVQLRIGLHRIGVVSSVFVQLLSLRLQFILFLMGFCL